jgi:murein DD-endopeptidase MepM/ murein hydrolase activator NlpD
MAAPFATWVFGGAGALLMLRGLWNPHRALTKSGTLSRCPGPTMGGFSETLQLAVADGEPVYSVGSGTVIASGDTFVHIQLSNEPVVIYYLGVMPDVAPGQHVMRGRKIGYATGGMVDCGVMGLGHADDGERTDASNWNLSSPGAVFYDVEPRSWLAVRGYEPTVKPMAETTAWCGPGRHISVPQDVHRQLSMPEKASFALLPVSVTEE